MAKKHGRFSGMLGALQTEKDKVTATEKKPKILSRVHRTSASPSISRRAHYRKKSSSETNPTESNEDCDEEPSAYVEYLEGEVDRLTEYAKKAEETKDSLRGLETLRKHLAYSIFIIIGVWLIAVFGLVFFGSLDVYYFKGDCNFSEANLLFRSMQVFPDACNFIGKGSVLNLSENIVIALITTTTFNVLGLAYIVARWLYPDSNGKKSKKAKKSESDKKSNNDDDAQAK